MNPNDQLTFATTLARSAGEIVRAHFGRAQRLTKTHAAASREAVTEVDRASQRHIVSALKKQFPTDGIIGEENEAGDAITFDVSNPAGRNWVIDPIDGTNNFLAGLGNFAVCIGLLEAGMPTLGVVYDVTRDILYSARAGNGAYSNDTRVRAPTTPLSDASLIMITSNLTEPGGHCPTWAARWLAQNTWKLRLLGSAALEAAAVAAGVAHAAITIKGKLWDCVAPAALILEAGGVITAPTGKPIFPFDLRNYAGATVPFLAGSPTAHATLLADILKNC
jgi:myo-inositol-1(or 4)-monophosphatase